jgi:hypothetical protein
MAAARGIARNPVEPAAAEGRTSIEEDVLAAGPAEERMPTQAKPPTALNAAPGAEAMPTQGAPRSGGRGRE